MKAESPMRGLLTVFILFAAEYAVLWVLLNLAKLCSQLH